MLLQGRPVQILEVPRGHAERLCALKHCGATLWKFAPRIGRLCFNRKPAASLVTMAYRTAAGGERQLKSQLRLLQQVCMFVPLDRLSTAASVCFVRRPAWPSQVFPLSHAQRVSSVVVWQSSQVAAQQRQQRHEQSRPVPRREHQSGERTPPAAKLPDLLKQRRHLLQKRLHLRRQMPKQPQPPVQPAEPTRACGSRKHLQLQQLRRRLQRSGGNTRRRVNDCSPRTSCPNLHVLYLSTTMCVDCTLCA